MSTPVHAAEQLSDLPVTPGQVLEGKFRIERIIGEGAMGLVVEARHLRLDERVALKFLRREARARPDIVARFSREARAAAKIRSDHVARVYDVGSTNETTFIVMEYLEGIDLETQIAKGGITVSQGVEFVIQACEGLASAHSQGIVHRDIKPANLFITDNGGIPEVKVLDFGISKAGISSGSSVDDIDVASGDTREIMGSPYYMSPEQIRSTKDVDGRADLWSLGVVLYEILTGRPPIIATEVTAIIAQVLHDPHPPLASLRADLPDGLITIVDRCLAKDPERRFQSAADLAVALLPFGPKRAREVVERAVAIESRASGNAFQGDSLPPSAPRSSLSARRTGDLALANTVPAGRPAAQPKAGNPLFAWLAFGAVVLGLAGGAYAFVTRIRQGPPPTAEASSPPASTSAIPTPSLLSPASASGATATAIATGSASGSPAGAGADAATMASPAATFRPLPAPRPRATPALSPASSPAPAATQESEIRHER